MRMHMRIVALKLSRSEVNILFMLSTQYLLVRFGAVFFSLCEMQSLVFELQFLVST